MCSCLLILTAMGNQQQGTPVRPGLMSLAMTSILGSARKVDCSVKISYYEVYMDRCYDLLQSKTEVSVLEDPSGRIQLRGLTQACVSNDADELYHQLAPMSTAILICSI